MRHVIFGSNADPDKLFVVPEQEVYFEMQRNQQGMKRLTAKFRGQSVTLPPGTAAKFIEMDVMTENGGYQHGPETREVKTSLINFNRPGND